MRMRTLALVSAICLIAMAMAYAGTVLRGTFALQGGVARTDGYLDAAPGAGSNAWKLDFWMTPRNGTPIQAYDLDMTKLLHVIIVSDDFKTFIHVHPRLLSNGHFVLDQTLPHAGIYHVYSDGRPSGIGQQVFRFDFQAGRTLLSAPRDLSERSAVAHVDGYSVTLSSLSLRSGSSAHITVRISKGGKPATDVHPYLRALAHAVFLDADDLTYVHVHPVSVGSSMGPASAMVYSNDTAVVPPNMLLSVAVTEPGTYKLWFQFHGGASLHVASFVLTADKR
jgi:hypothetical protein